MEFKPQDYIYKEDQHIPVEELQGEENVLNSPVIQGAFERILNDFEPHHPNAIFSLCTKTRPYLKSRKWSQLYKFFGDTTDMIICSNGGIIPIEYMNCYPFTIYDAPHDKSYDELYKQRFKERLLIFLDKFKYKNIILLFTPGTRNYEALKDLDIPNSILIPDEVQYQKIKAGEEPYIGFSSSRQPLLAYSILNKIESIVGQSTVLHEYIDSYNGLDKRPMQDAVEEMWEGLDEHGYTMDQLVDKLKVLVPIYSTIYMQKKIRINTDNVGRMDNMKGKDLFHYQEGFYYKYRESGNYPTTYKKLF